MADLAPQRSNKFNLQIDIGALLFSESILLCGLLFANLSDNSLAVTQIGTLAQFLLISLFYLAIGRFGIDPFQSKDKFTKVTFLTIFLTFLTLYILSVAIKSGALFRFWR